MKIHKCYASKLFPPKYWLLNPCLHTTDTSFHKETIFKISFLKSVADKMKICWPVYRLRSMTRWIWKDCNLLRELKTSGLQGYFHYIWKLLAFFYYIFAKIIAGIKEEIDFICISYLQLPLYLSSPLLSQQWYRNFNISHVMFLLGLICIWLMNSVSQNTGDLNIDCWPCKRSSY